MNKRWKIALTILPIAVSLAAVGTYFAVAVAGGDRPAAVSNPKPAITTTANDDKFEVFPRIESYDFYDRVRINNGVPVIDDNMVARVVEEVLLKMQFANGTVEWAYKRVDEATVYVFFKWNPMNGLVPKSHVYKLYVTVE